ncbi:MAG: class I SAM-dependent methyltransferase [Phormidesmis sp.]
MTSRYADYNNWAWLYNQTMGPEYSQPQLDLLKRVLLPHIPPQGKILDLCCGTGQLIQPLIDAGYQVTGLDGSENMLSYARENAPQATYCLADARTFDLGDRSFDGIFSTSASLNHIMTIEDLTQVFNRVYASLQDGGMFVFDLNHPQQLERWWQGRPTEGALSRHYAWIITPHYDASLAKGDFQVTISQATVSQATVSQALERSPNPTNTLLSPVKRLIYALLSRPRFIGLRLKLIQNINRFEPHWKSRELTYPVKGHSLNDVKTALEKAGFEKISIQTIDGNSEIDTHHSAHFICSKSALRQPSSQTTLAQSANPT